MPKKEEIKQPVLKEVTVAYRSAVKANLGDFENADIDVTESETWTVEGLSADLTEALLEDRYDVLKERIDARVTAFYTDNSKNC
jgi:hypothetical protein